MDNGNFFSIKKIVFCFLILYGSANSIYGQTTVSYTGMGTITCPATPTATISPSVSGLTFSQLSRGSGVTCGTASTGISGSVFNVSLASAVSGSKWYTYSITSDATVSFTVSAFSVVSQVSTAVAGNSVDVQYSIGAGAMTSIGSFTPTGSSATYSIIPGSPISVGASQTLNIFFIPNNLSASGTTCRINNATSVTLTTTPTCTPPATPTAPTAAANPSCGATFLNTLTAAAGETWYWETTSTGTSTANPTSATYPVSTTGTYYVMAQNNTTSCWSTASSSLLVTINSAPAISVQPSNASATVGTTSVYSLTASGAGLTYQWQENQSGSWTNITNGGIYSGATTAALTLTGVTAGMNSWQYRCIVSGTCTPSVTSTAVTLTIVTTAVGDYESRASGNWGISTSWEKWSGSAWVACSAGDFPNSSTASVTILNGHTIDQDGSGSPPFDVKNLTINSGGKVWDNHFTGSNTYLQIYGNIVCDGTIGNPSGDDISFDIAGGTTCTISGSGSFTATRIRKDNAINPSSDVNLTIDMNILLTWNSASGTVLYNDGSTANYNVTVNAGKTLRASAPGANVGNIAIDGSSFSAPDAANSGGTYTVYGTIDIDGIIYATTNNTVASRSCNYLIKTGGLIKCRYIRADASSSAGSSITIETGGKLKIFGSIDTTTATNNDTTWARYSATNNTYNFQAGSIVEYSASTQQQLNGIAGYKNLIISGGGLKKLGLDVTVSEALTLTSGVVKTNAYKMIMSSTTSSDLIHSTGTASFINGNLRRYILSNTSTYEFPVGDGNATSNYKRADIINNNLTGIAYIDGYVAAITEASPNDDATFVTAGQTQNGTPLTNILENAQWDFTPDAAPSGGTYGVRLYTANTGLSASDDNTFCPVKRPSSSTSYIDWVSMDASTTIPAYGAAGRIYSSGAGYAERLGYPSFSKHAIAKGVSPLPIELLSFNAHYNGNTVDLDWTTASELNNDYFTIERTIDGTTFSKIATVDGAGNSTSRIDYHCVDETPVSGISYYRLKQTDFDGKISYSDLRTVSISGNVMENMSLYPNPVSAQLTIALNLNTDTKVKLCIINILGEAALMKELFVTVGSSLLTVDLSALSSGQYMLRIIDETGSFIAVKKIQKN